MKKFKCPNCEIELYKLPEDKSDTIIRCDCCGHEFVFKEILLYDEFENKSIK